LCHPFSCSTIPVQRGAPHCFSLFSFFLFKALFPVTSVTPVTTLPSFLLHALRILLLIPGYATSQPPLNTSQSPSLTWIIGHVLCGLCHRPYLFDISFPGVSIPQDGLFYLPCFLCPLLPGLHSYNVIKITPPTETSLVFRNFQGACFFCPALTFPFLKRFSLPSPPLIVPCFVTHSETFRPQPTFPILFVRGTTTKGILHSSPSPN